MASSVSTAGKARAARLSCQAPRCHELNLLCHSSAIWLAEFSLFNGAELLALDTEKDILIFFGGGVLAHWAFNSFWSAARTVKKRNSTFNFNLNCNEAPLWWKNLLNLRPSYCESWRAEGVGLPAVSQPQFAESFMKVSECRRYFARVTQKAHDLFCLSHVGRTRIGREPADRRGVVARGKKKKSQ